MEDLTGCCRTADSVEGVRGLQPVLSDGLTSLPRGAAFWGVHSPHFCLPLSWWQEGLSTLTDVLLITRYEEAV